MEIREFFEKKEKLLEKIIDKSPKGETLRIFDKDFHEFFYGSEKVSEIITKAINKKGMLVELITTRDSDALNSLYMSLGANRAYFRHGIVNNDISLSERNFMLTSKYLGFMFGEGSEESYVLTDHKDMNDLYFKKFYLLKKNANI